MQVEQLMSKQGTVIDSPLLITPACFGDERGWFMESWNQKKFDQAVGEAVTFSQDNHSRSTRGVLGPALSVGTEPQAKLVRSSVGAIYDVAVDIRQDQPPSANGLEPSSALRTKHSFGSRRALPTDFSP